MSIVPSGFPVKPRTKQTRLIRKFSALLSSVGVVLLVFAGTAAPANAGGAAKDLTFDEKLNCAFNTSACLHAEDAKRWAKSVTKWKFPNESDLNTRADAFRHCIWSAALTNRVGVETAWQILSTHETSAVAQPEEQLQMDMLNNYTGTRIGMDSRREGGKDQWGWIMKKCEKLARSGQLEVLQK